MLNICEEKEKKERKFNSNSYYYNYKEHVLVSSTSKRCTKSVTGRSTRRGKPLLAKYSTQYTHNMTLMIILVVKLRLMCMLYTGGL